MIGSPNTFLPRTLFSEDEADSVADIDAQTEDGWDMASEAMRKAQRPPRLPSDSFDSDDEDGPLHWSSFHAQIEALLKTVQKPPRREGLDTAPANNRHYPEDQGAFSCDPYSPSNARTAAKDGGASDAASDSSADELLAYMTGDTASHATAGADTATQQRAHSEVYGHPLPSWLYELATSADGGGAPENEEGRMAAGESGSTMQGARVGQAAQAQEQGQGTVPLDSACRGGRKALPEWLTSPARPLQPGMGFTTGSSSGVEQLSEAVARTPFKSLIEEIEANLAAGLASLSSTSFLYSDDAPSQPGHESLHWFTNELAKVAAEAQDEFPMGSPRSSVDGSTGGSVGRVSDEDASCRTPSRQLPVFQEELAELDPLAQSTDAAVGEPSLEGTPTHQAQAEPGDANMFGSPAVQCVETELTGGGGSPACRSEASPEPQQERISLVPSYRILRPSVSPRSIVHPPEPPGWAFLDDEPASHEEADAEISEGSSCSEHEVPMDAVHMPGGRRVLSELHSNSFLQRDCSLAQEAGKASPPIKVFVDKGGQLEGAAAPRPEEDQLTAVYAQIEALSRDLRGTHDELEQLRHAEAQLKGIYEGLAQQPASPPGVVQSSMGPAFTPDWAAHISPQQVVELEAAKRVLAQRLDALTAELADKDARLALITAQLHHAKEQLAAKQREADVLLGETLGLQDVLTEAGAEASATAAQLAALEMQLERSQARVQEVEVELAEREAELAQCRGQLHRTEQLLEKARQAAANQGLAEAAAPAPAQPQAASPAAKPGAQEDFSFATGGAAGAGGGRSRPSSAEELSRAMVTPPLVERRAADREGSVGLTPPFTPSLDQTHRSALAFHNGKSPAWAAATPVLRPGQPFAAQRPGYTPGGRSAWDVPFPSPMGTSSASNAALASVLATIRAREDHGERVKSIRAEQASMPDSPLASVLRRMNSRSSMESAALV